MAIKPSILQNNYVKFVRTSLTLWGNLLKKDSDTLYFVIDGNDSTGSLYLGNTLIAAGLDKGTSVEDLRNVVITGDITKDQILVADGEGYWHHQSIYDFMPQVMSGASESKDGAGGLVPEPAAGQHNLFLQGDGTWANPTTALESTVSNLSTKVGGLEEVLNGVIGEDLDKTIREVATDVTTTAVSNLINGAPEAFNTLKEIADWITGDYSAGVDAADLISDVSNLKNVVLSETTGLVSKVGVLESSVSNLSDAFNALADVVGGEGYGLVQAVADNAANIAINQSKILEIDAMLKWNELIDDPATD